MVGMNGVATASVAYHEALAYARDAPAGPAARRARSRRAAGAHHRARRRAPHAAAAEGDRRGRPALLLATRLAYADLAAHARRRGGARSARALLARSADAGGEDASPPSAASRPTRSRCRSTAATATPASTCPRRGCATRSSTPSTRAPPASRAWTCSGARWSRRAARRSRHRRRRWGPRFPGQPGRGCWKRDIDAVRARGRDALALDPGAVAARARRRPRAG